MNIKQRVAESTDLPFIFSTWLKGLYHGNPWYRKINQDTFYAKYHKVIEQILMRNHIEVACLEDEPDVIVGYVVYTSSGILHWVFVKKAWRNQGIAKNLVPQNIQFISHLTKVGEALWKKKLPKAVFDPFLF